jgi:hypothetical protein
MVLKIGHFGTEIRNTRRDFKMWCWKRTEIISSSCVKNKEVLYRVKKDINILCVKIREANWRGHILSRNYLLNTLLKEVRRNDRKKGRTRGEA